MKKYAIIVAAGNGNRMKSKLPKQFMQVAGAPLLWHTMKRFYAADHSTIIVLVLPRIYINKWPSLVSKVALDFSYSIIAGGKTRFESVKNGLEMVKDRGIVAVHDGVRPLASKRLINRCFEEAEKKGSAIPCVALNDSLRKVSGKKSHVVDRSQYAIIQTPQCFHSKVILKAYQQPYQKSFTDDATVVESMGKKIHLVEGESENIKITYPIDLLFAKMLLTRDVQM